MQINSKLFRIFFCYCLLLAVCYLFSGCAAVPVKESGLASYNINGISYVPLVSLCELRNINWDYDTFTRRVTLTQGSQQVNLLVGSSQVIVNGASQDLKQPVDIYEGMVVVPYRFKKDVLDNLFKSGFVPERQALIYIKRIIIDPGHGGDDPGAIGITGLMEKYVCLDIAKRLKNLLTSEGAEVILTRNYDKTLTLAGRSEVANSCDADLFISIHANANRVRRLNGFEVYYLTSDIDDGKRALLTAAENAEPHLKGVLFGSNNIDLKATVWDLIYTQNRAESMELARSICRAVGNNLEIKVLGIKEAPFFVLKTTHMPAVLVEVGFLSNLYEERGLRNDFYRQQIAEAISQGVRSYSRRLITTVQVER
jgi:N-acetylmuramoyl-L-alanine amidase